MHLDPDVHVALEGDLLRVSATAGDTPLLAYEPGLRADAIVDGCRCGDSRSLLVLREPPKG